MALIRGARAARISRLLSRSEMERQAMRSRYAQLVEQALDIFLLIGPDGRIRDANTAALSAYGYERDELLQKHARELRAPGHEVDFDTRWAEAAAPEGARYETVHQRRDSTTFPVEISATVFGNEGHEHRQLFIRDISARKAAEAAIERLAANYAVLAQTNELLVRARDESTLFGDICQIAVTAGGYLAAWVGVPDEVGSIVVVAKAGAADAYIDALRLVTDPSVTEGRGPTAVTLREGRAIHVQDFLGATITSPWHELGRNYGIRATVAMPLKRAGVAVGAFTLYSSVPDCFTDESVALLDEMAEDISFALTGFAVEEERRRSVEALMTKEAEVSRLNAELEQHVEERTAQLAAVNQELESFSYSVSHDLRAPLRSVVAFTGLLDRRYRDTLDETAGHYLDNILTASRQMGALIGDLLDYSRLGRTHVAVGPVPLAPLFAELAATFGERITEAGVAFTTSGGPPTPDGDPTLLRQILLNLVDNAITYRRPGVVPEVAVTAERQDETVVIAVRDNGIGIPAEALERIFDVFARLHTEAEYPGTGIGLASVRKAARRMGSDITLSSTVGVGSRFEIRLALADEQVAVAELAVATPGGAGR
jgi:PAS domain S-box-containing protein